MVKITSQSLLLFFSSDYYFHKEKEWFFCSGYSVKQVLIVTTFLYPDLISGKMMEIYLIQFQFEQFFHK